MPSRPIPRRPGSGSAWTTAGSRARTTGARSARSTAWAPSSSTRARSPSRRITPRCWSAPTPAEILLAALASCLTSGLGNIAAVRKINLESVESRIEGDIDLRGILGLSDEVRKGFSRIRVSFRVRGDASPEALRQLVEQAVARSAVYDVLTQGVPISVDVAAG